MKLTACYRLLMPNSVQFGIILASVSEAFFYLSDFRDIL